MLREVIQYYSTNGDPVMCAQGLDDIAEVLGRLADQGGVEHSDLADLARIEDACRRIRRRSLVTDSVPLATRRRQEVVENGETVRLPDGVHVTDLRFRVTADSDGMLRAKRIYRGSLGEISCAQEGAPGPVGGVVP